MSDSIFKNRFPGYFEIAEAIVDAIEAGDFVRGRPEGLPDGNDEAFIVHRAALPNADPRIRNVDGLLATAFSAQMTNEEMHTQIPHKFAFGATRFDGNGCFFFRWPDNKDIDISSLRERIQFFKDMMSEASPDVSVLQTQYYEDQIAIGPVPEQRYREFDVLLNKLLSYNVQNNDYSPIPITDVPYEQGMVFLFNRSDYKALFRHEIDFNPIHSQRRSSGAAWRPADRKMQ
jgi:hypothetical protein